MAELAPVPAPRSPFDGWRGRAVSLVVVAVLLAIAKPWGDPTDPARPLPTALGTDRPPPVVVVPLGRAYEPGAFGPAAPRAAWALLIRGRTIPLDFVERGDATMDVAGPISASAVPADVVVSGPVVELGSSDEVDAIGIAHPVDRTITTIRAWRFATDGAPRRLELGRLPSPWPAASIAVVGHRDAGMDAGRILPWEPGLYRLDLLAEPGSRIVSVMAHVAAGRDAPSPVEGAGGGGGDGTVTDDREPFETASLDLLPDSANLWAASGYLSGWGRDGQRPDCRIAEIWRAIDPADDCWPLPLGRTDAIGVNLVGGQTVASIGLLGVDPLPGPAAVVAQLEVGGRPGRALVRGRDGALPDGIYRLDVRTTAGVASTWYLEVGPIGRAVASYYEASTSR